MMRVLTVALSLHRLTNPNRDKTRKYRQNATNRPHPDLKNRGIIFDTLRTAILNRHPHIATLVQERFPDDPAGEQAFSYALELFLCANLNAALDGWKMFQLVTDTATSLRAVGIVYVLPHGELPAEVTLSASAKGVQYRLQIGTGDPQWKSLSDAKRWKVVYLYANGERDEVWTWATPISGYLTDG